MSTLIRWVLLTLILLFPGCHTPKISSSDAEDTSDSAIILVPGYYGTRLVHESDGRIIWISASEALFGSQPLTLPVPGLELAHTVELRPDGILDTVRVIPLLYSVDVYGSLLDELRTSHKSRADVIPLAYDWRGDLMEAVRSLDATIRQLRTDGKHDIALIAHSMGGLIVSYYLRYGTQDISSAVETWEGAETVSAVVMAGVPFLGVMNSFRNMNFGVTVKLNTSLLTAEAYASFPSSYYTLPVFDSDQLVTPGLKPLHDMIRNPENWERSGWGLLDKKTALSGEIVKRRADYMAFWLRRSQRFLELLRAPLTTSNRHHATLLYLYAKSTPTLAKGVWMRHDMQGPDSLFFDNRDPAPSLPSIDPDMLYDDGDETVTVQSALLPPAYLEAFQTTVQEYEVGHTELVTRSEIQQDIITFLKRR